MAAKQDMVGPLTLARGGDRAEVLAAAEALNEDLRALAAAGCPLIEIHEPAAIEIGTDEPSRRLFRDAHRRLLDGVDGPHLSLAIIGGNADATGIETLLSAPYASLAVDLIAGPDNWRLVVATPGDRGIVCGALSPEPDSDDAPEVLLWAAAYAASTAGRGPARVGLATAGSLAKLSWEAAVGKMRRLGEAARLADLPPDELRRAIDPRAVDIRSAALGRVGLRRPGRGRRSRA
jgi:methionine synthase II (cobalamin-independent)